MVYNGTNRKRLAENTRQKIYDSAMHLFSTKSFNKVSVDSIVEMAGVSKGSFYVHFSSKSALGYALIIVQGQSAVTDYSLFLESFSDDAPAEDLLLALIGKIADVVVDKIGYDKMKTVYKAQIADDVDTQTVTNYNRAIYKLFSDILERGIKRGELNSSLPLELLTRHLMMAIRGITYEWCIRSPEFNYKEEALQYFKLLIEGLRNPSLSSNRQM